MKDKKRILIVDDDFDFANVQSAILERAGYEVAVAHNSKECREKLLAAVPDIIILDVMMDTMTEGFDLARELHSSKETGDVPLLMVTAIMNKLEFHWNNTNIDGKWLPIDDILEKPFTPEMLLSKIDKCLQKKQNTEDSETEIE